MINFDEYLIDKSEELKKCEYIQMAELHTENRSNRTFICGKVTDIHGKSYNIVASTQEDENTWQYEADKLIIRIEHGLEAVEKLNTRLNDMYNSDLIDLRVSYRWSCYAYKSSITRWDYNSIEITLSSKCSENLYNSISGIDDIIAIEEFQVQFPKFIMNINNNKINRSIGVFFDNIGEALIEKMLKRKDVVELLKNSDRHNNMEKYKFVCNIADRDILAIVNLVIDYKKLEDTVTIEESRYIDTDKCEFIHDEKTCNAIIDLMRLSKEERRIILSDSSI